MERISAGLVVYRMREGQLEILLAHPGGPFFAKKDDGHWTIPKGEIEEGEDYLVTAIRELTEETGLEIDPRSKFVELGSIRQKGGKVVHAWGVQHDCPNPLECKSTFQMEWPPRSGKWQTFPEIDRAQFHPMEIAKRKIKETQIPLLERLDTALNAD